MTEPIKFPSIPHLPWGEAAAGSDRVLKNTNHFLGLRMGAFEKLDGECTGMTRDQLWARSVNGYPRHPSRSWMRALWSCVRQEIPEGLVIFGENVYATHSIHYTALPTYFFVFAMVDAHTGKVLDWLQTQTIADDLGLRTVPLLRASVWDSALFMATYTGQSRFGGAQEGYVVRNMAAFPLAETVGYWAKYLRPTHVQTDDHWMNQPVVPNGLKG